MSLLLCGIQQGLSNFLVGAHPLSSRKRIHGAPQQQYVSQCGCIFSFFSSLYIYFSGLAGYPEFALFTFTCACTTKQVNRSTLNIICSVFALSKKGFTLTSWSLLEMPRTEFIHFLFLCHCRQRSPAWRENNPRFRYQESVGEPSHPSCPEAPFVWQYTNAGMQLYICKCFENECPLTQKLSYCPLILQLEQNLELSEFNKQVLGVLPKLTCSLYLTFSR